MKYRETRRESALEIPTIRRTVGVFGRAFLLRCPHCGKGPVLQHWLKLRVKCGHCGLRLQRGEHDSFTGSMFILFSLVGLSGYAILMLTLFVTDATPWALLEKGLPLAALALVVVFFPFSKLLWLALDLVLRPASEDEMRWHQSADTEFDIDSPHTEP